MITKESLIEVAEKIYDNIKVKFVEDKDPEESHWDIMCIDPDEPDEYMSVAKLYYQLGVLTTFTDWEYPVQMDLDETPEEILRIIIDDVQTEIDEKVSFYNVLSMELS